MTNAHHDAAVQLLTDSQRFVRLVVQRDMKGPLEPPQSPRSPLLKGLSPSGYLANRPGVKRSFGESIMQHTSSDSSPKGTEVTNDSIYTAAPTETLATNSIIRTNGIDSNAGQPVPAPRRLTSTGSISGATNGSAASHNGSSTGNKSEDDEPQVSLC